MKIASAIRKLLAVLMIAGLVMAPVSQPVMAANSSDLSMQAHEDMSPSTMTEATADDMPCCPAKAPASSDCDKCIYMTACASKCFTGMSASVFHPLLQASIDVVSLSNDSRPEGLGSAPPDHPPRTLV